MAEVTEIVEESAVQLEIVETSGGQIEVVDNSGATIEIVESKSSIDDNLDILTEVNILTIDNPSDNFVVETPSTSNIVVETTITDNIIEITENQVVFQTGSIINIVDGLTDSDLKISQTLFANVLSSSKLEVRGKNQNTDLLILRTFDNTSVVKVNSQGIVILDDYQYTPTPIKGGLLYSGSEFYLGLE